MIAKLLPSWKNLNQRAAYVCQCIRRRMVPLTHLACYQEVNIFLWSLTTTVGTLKLPFCSQWCQKNHCWPPTDFCMLGYAQVTANWKWSLVGIRWIPAFSCPKLAQNTIGFGGGLQVTVSCNFKCSCRTHERMHFQLLLWYSWQDHLSWRLLVSNCLLWPVWFKLWRWAWTGQQHDCSQQSVNRPATWQQSAESKQAAVIWVWTGRQHDCNQFLQCRARAGKGSGQRQGSGQGLLVHRYNIMETLLTGMGSIALQSTQL